MTPPIRIRRLLQYFERRNRSTGAWRYGHHYTDWTWQCRTCPGMYVGGTAPTQPAALAAGLAHLKTHTET